MSEVAEGLRHIHSEGIVHGDLYGVRILISGLSTSTTFMSQENILLDSTFRCQISGFGLARHSAATMLSMLNFAAPELFIRSDNCDQTVFDKYYEHYNMRERKTMQTDVYAFGCLYYAVGVCLSSALHLDFNSSRYFSMPCLFRKWSKNKFPGLSLTENVQLD